MDKCEFDSNVKLITELVTRALAEAKAATAEPCHRQATVSDCAQADDIVIHGMGNGKSLVTEKEVLQLKQRHQTTLVCTADTIITALAQDRLKQEGITVIRK